jgi:hypothetical protein
MPVCANPDCGGVWFGSGWQIENSTPRHFYNGKFSSRAYKVYARKKFCSNKCSKTIRQKKWRDFRDGPEPTDPIQKERWLKIRKSHREYNKAWSKRNKNKPKKKVEKVFQLEKTTPTSVWVPKAFFTDPKYREGLTYDLGNKATSGFYSIKKVFNY